MSEQQKMKFKNIGTMMKAKPKTSDPDEPKRFYIKLENQKNKDGKVYGENIFPLTLKDGDILSMFPKKPKFQNLVKEGKMSQDKADELSDFLIFDICVVTPDDGSSSNNSGEGVPF